jgi:hypothetical protein
MNPTKLRYILFGVERVRVVETLRHCYVVKFHDGRRGKVWTFDLNGNRSRVSVQTAIKYFRPHGRPRIWENYTTFSVYKTCEGGPGREWAMQMLRDAKIPCRPGYSPYMGQVGIDVPKSFAKRAERIL